MPLTDTKVRNLKPAGKTSKVADGGGLYLQVNASGSKLWRMAYRFAGKQKTLSFGNYPAVSLATARRDRDDAKALIAAGTDPSDIVREQKLRARMTSENTFGAIAYEFLEKCAKEAKAETTLNKKRWLLEQARSALFHRSIAEISAAEILVPLRAVEAKGNYESARRLRAEIGQVFRYAIATARAENDPTFGLRGALITPVVQHRAAFTDKEGLAGLLKAVWGYEGAPETRAGLKLMAYLYPRPGELRKAEWSEFDLDKGIWTIPKTRMKMRREHIKPLPNAAVEVLPRPAHSDRAQGAGFSILPISLATDERKTLNAALRRMGFTKTEATAHGFRASASSLLNESGLWAPDAVEAELAHVGADEVRNAYHRTTYWNARVK